MGADAHGDSAGYAADLDGAVDAAAMQALPELMSSIEAALAPQQDAGKSGVTVRVLGVRRWQQLTAVRSALERVSGVEAVEPRRFNPGAPGSIELLARTSMPVKSIVDGLRRTAGASGMGVREIDGAAIVDVPELGDPGAGAPEPKGQP
jgi:hypothetical protein